jgi:F-type H+-transporting ATPase subunit b
MRCGWFVGVALVIAGMLCMPAPAVRGQHPHEPTEKGAESASAAPEGHGGGGGGSSKLFSRALDLSLWTIVVFLILAFILHRYAWGPMMKGLEARENSIHQAVDEAHKAREETARLRDEVMRERAKAAEEARAMIDQARRDAQKQADELRAKAVAEIHAERDRLRRDLELARDAALQDLWARTAQLAALVSSRAIGRELSADDHRKLADEAIADLRRAGAERQREVAGV